MEPSADGEGAMKQLLNPDTTSQSVHCTSCGRWPAPDIVHGDHYCERCAGQFLTPDRLDTSLPPETSLPEDPDTVGESRGGVRVADNHRPARPSWIWDRPWPMLRAR